MTVSSMGWVALVILYIGVGGSWQSSKALNNPKPAVGLGTDA